MSADDNIEYPESGFSDDANVTSPTVKHKLSANVKDPGSRVILIVSFAAILIAGSFLAWLFGGDSEAEEAVTVLQAPPRGGPDTLVEGQNATEQRIQERREEDNARAEQALKSGSFSAVRPLGEQYDFGELDNLPLPPTETADANVSPPPFQGQVETQPEPTPTPTEAPDYSEQLAFRTDTVFDNAERKREEMLRVLEAANRTGTMGTFDMPPATRGVRFERTTAADNGGTPSSQRPPTVSTAPTTNSPPSRVVVKAGSLYYGVMEDAADSDYSAPVFARIFSGPLKGSTLRGQYEASQNYRCLVIRFDQITPPGNEESVDIDALAVTPYDNVPCLATERNARYLQRFGGVVLVGTLQGLGASAQQSNTRVVQNSDGSTVTDYGEATDRVIAGSIAGGIAEQGVSAVQESLLTTPRVVVAKDTEIGIRFISDVKSGNVQTTAYQLRQRRTEDTGASIAEILHQDVNAARE